MIAITLVLALLPGMQERPLAELDLHELALRVPSEAQMAQVDFWTSPEALAFEELEGRLLQGARLTFEDWKLILLDRGWLRWRDRWPEAEPFAVGMHRPPFRNCGTALELVPRVKDWQPARWSLRSGGCVDPWIDYEFEDYQVLGTLSEPEMALEFDLCELRRVPGAGTELVRLGSFTLHVRRVASYEECLPALKDKLREAQISRQLARALELRQPGSPGGEAGYALTIDPALRIPGVALGLAATLREAGRATAQTWGVPLGAARRFQWEAGGAQVQNAMRAAESGNLIDQMALMERPKHPFDSLRVTGQSIILRGAAKQALRDWDAREYWAGEIEVSLADLIRH